MTKIAAQHQSAKGRVRWQVIDAATQQVVREASDWNRNMILNIGMDSVAARSWVANMTYCVAGTGTTPTSSQSGATTAAQSGSTVDLSGGSFQFDAGSDVGNVIVWTTGEQAQISGVNSISQAVVSNSATVGSNQFTLYRTNQTGLTTEVKRTHSYLTGVGYCGTTIVGSTFQHRRTYDFTVESQQHFYAEVGLSDTGSAGPNLFSRILLDAPVEVDVGQQLRIVYELHVTVGPTAPVSRNAVINGWPVAPSAGTAGTECLQMYGMAIVLTSGSEYNTNSTLAANEPSALTLGSISTYAYLSADNRAIATWGATPSRVGGASHVMTMGAYVAGAYQVDKSATFAVGEANAANWIAMGYGVNLDNSFNNLDPAGTGCQSVFLFNEMQTKTNTHTLTLTWRWTWSRDFS